MVAQALNVDYFVEGTIGVFNTVEEKKWGANFCLVRTIHEKHKFFAVGVGTQCLSV